MAALAGAKSANVSTSDSGSVVLLHPFRRAEYMCIKLAYCSSIGRSWVQYPASWAPIFFFRVSFLSHILLPSLMICTYMYKFL